MTHRIYKAICTVAVVVFLCSLALIMELLYNYFSSVPLNQMKELAGMTARGVELNGNSFFDDPESVKFDLLQTTKRPVATAI